MRIIIFMFTMVWCYGGYAQESSNGLRNIKAHTVRHEARSDTYHAGVDRLNKATNNSRSGFTPGKGAPATSSGTLVTKEQPAKVLTSQHCAAMDRGGISNTSGSVAAPFIPGGSTVSAAISGLSDLKDAASASNNASLGSANGG